MPTEKEITALIDAMDQLLDDMGEHGQSVCLAAKAQARIAFEPFFDPEIHIMDMPLIEAQRVMSEQ
jgi:hypothetical protein